MKTLWTILLLIISTSVIAGDWYVGAGVGFSETNYNIEDDVEEYIDDSGNRNLTNVLALVGHPLVVNSDFSSLSYRFIGGWRFADSWDLELMSASLGNYDASASIDIQENGNILGHTVDANVNGKSSAKISIKTVSLSFIKRWQDRSNKLVFFNRLGITHFTGDLNTSTTLSYNYNITGTDVNLSDSNREVNISQKTIRSYSPHFGAGIQYNIDDTYSLRFEYVRYGHPSRGVRLDNATVDFLIDF